MEKQTNTNCSVLSLTQGSNKGAPAPEEHTLTITPPMRSETRANMLVVIYIHDIGPWVFWKTSGTCREGTSYTFGTTKFTPSLNTGLVTRTTQRVVHVVKELLTLSEQLSLPVRVAGSLDFCLAFCKSLFVLFFFFLLNIVLSVLSITPSDYIFGIFKICLLVYVLIRKWTTISGTGIEYLASSRGNMCSEYPLVMCVHLSVVIIRHTHTI